MAEVNKVVYGGNTLIDLTGDTVTADKLLQGYTAHAANGESITGTYTPSTISLQTKTKSYTPTESAQSETVTADSGYDGLSSVDISVGAISSTYVGSDIPRPLFLNVSGNTVTAPAGYYAEAKSGWVLGGSVTAPSTISGTTSTVTVGTNLVTLKKTVSVTPDVTTAGYITSGTAGNSEITLTGIMTTKSAATYTPGTTDQTISANRYLLGAQTIEGDANLVASNIKNGVSIFGVTGTYVGGATNFVSGTFTTQTTTAEVQSITIPYTGTGYPIAGLVYIDGGVYNSSSTYGGNTTWYNSTQRYAVGEWAFTKTRVPQTPDWGTSGSGNAGVIAVIYKNSTSNSGSYSRTSAMSVVVLTSNAPTSTATEVIKFSNNKTMKVYIASNSYGLIANTKYAYHLIYSS